MGKVGRPLIDEAGKKYGCWTVLEQVGGPNHWLCRCECGTEKRIPGGNLRSGMSTNCGCVPTGTTLPPGVAAFNRLLRGWKAGAKSRGYKWKLSKEQAEYLSKQPCHYCGKEPEQEAHNGRGHSVYLYNGLDRVDNDKGYFLGNIVPCCKTCNYAKRDMSIDKFEDWFQAVHKHYFLGEL